MKPRHWYYPLRQPRWSSLLLRSAALALGLVAIATLSVSQEIDPSALPVESDLAVRLKSHVEYLAGPDLSGRKPGTAGNRAAAQYIIEYFREVGLAPLPSLDGYGQEISAELGDNLIGVREAMQPLQDAPWLLIGAHYDHLGGKFLGADDNAAAIAILLETARSLGPLTHHPVLFVAFNAEELPYIRTALMGSQHFVDHLPPEIGAPSQFKAVIIMDLMGGVHWKPLRDVIFAAGAEKSPGLYRRLKDAANQVGNGNDEGGEGLRTEGRGLSLSAESSALSTGLSVLPVGLHVIEEIPVIGPISFSDYDAFRNAQVPFLFLSSGRTPRYHQTSDLPDTLHYERMAATVRWLQTLVRLVDQDITPYGFQTDRIEFADEVAALRPIVEQAADWDSRIPYTSIISYWKLRRDHEWLQRLNPSAPTPESLKRLERTSIRIQCLLADFYACFLF